MSIISPSSWRANWGLVLGCVLLVGVAWQMFTVRQENSVIKAALQREHQGIISAGDGMGALAGTRLDGHYARYLTDNGARSSLVVAMSVDCGFCEQNIDAWRRLSALARQGGMQVIWVSRDVLGDADRAKGFDESLIAEPTYQTYVRLRLSTVPQTIVVERNGRVAYAHAGTLDAVRERDVAKIIAAGTAQ